MHLRNNCILAYKGNMRIGLFLPITVLIYWLTVSTAFGQQTDNGVKNVAAFKIPNGKSVTISGNIKKLLKPNKNMTDSFAFQYQDLITGKRITFPIEKDTFGNFSITFPVELAQEVYLTQAFKLPSGIFFSGSREFSFFVQPGQRLDMDYFRSADGRQMDIIFKGEEGLANRQLVLYRKALDESGFSSLIDYSVFDSLKFSDIDVFKKYVSERLKAGIAFNMLYFEKVSASRFIKEQADYDMQFAAVNWIIQSSFKFKLGESLVKSFLQDNSIQLNSQGAFSSESYAVVLDQLYLLFKTSLEKKTFEKTFTLMDAERYLLPIIGQLTPADQFLVRKLKDSVFVKDPVNKAKFSDLLIRHIDDYVASLPGNLPEFDAMIAQEDPFLRDLLATKALYAQIDTERIKYIEPNLQVYKDKVQSKSLKEKFLAEYKSAYDLRFNSKLSPKSIFNSSLDLATENPINTIIKKHIGKVVYIDIWATWCKPCLIEMANAKKLREKLAGKDVEFVYICTSSDSEKTWKELVATYVIEGQNYFLNKAQGDVVKNLYKIDSIPRYLLFDKAGAIVDDKAGKPSDIKLLKTIESLLSF